MNNTGITLNELSCISINPTSAYRMLEDFETLKEGDVIIQNGANGMVGKCIIQIAKAKGIKTINLVRDGKHYDEQLARLKAYGADVVENYETFATSREIRRLISEFSRPKLALNSVGGISVTDMARMLA